jgi:hypothetical protein
MLYDMEQAYIKLPVFCLCYQYSMYLLLGCDCKLRAMFSVTIFIILKIITHLVASMSSFWR